MGFNSGFKALIQPLPANTFSLHSVAVHTSKLTPLVCYTVTDSPPPPFLPPLPPPSPSIFFSFIFQSFVLFFHCCFLLTAFLLPFPGFQKSFRKSSSHLKSVDTRKMTRSKFHTKYPQKLGAIVYNIVARYLCTPCSFLLAH